MSSRLLVLSFRSVRLARQPGSSRQSFGLLLTAREYFDQTVSAFLNERSPNKIKWDRHSSLTDRTYRSAKAFKFGLRGGSRRPFTPPLPRSRGIQGRTWYRDRATRSGSH